MYLLIGLFVWWWVNTFVLLVWALMGLVRLDGIYLSFLLPFPLCMVMQIPLPDGPCTIAWRVPMVRMKNVLSTIPQNGIVAPPQIIATCTSPFMGFIPFLCRSRNAPLMSVTQRRTGSEYHPKSMDVFNCDLCSFIKAQFRSCSHP